jgi:hypothetical protein
MFIIVKHVMQQYADLTAVQVEEVTLHLPSPQSQPSRNIPSPSDSLVIQQAPDSMNMAITSECINPFLSSPLVNQSPSVLQVFSRLCNAAAAEPQNLNDGASLGLRIDEESCSSCSFESADSNTTDRHKDMAFT